MTRSHHGDADPATWTDMLPSDGAPESFASGFKRSLLTNPSQKTQKSEPTGGYNSIDLSRSPESAEDTKRPQGSHVTGAYAPCVPHPDTLGRREAGQGPPRNDALSDVFKRRLPPCLIPPFAACCLRVHDRHAAPGRIIPSLPTPLARGMHPAHQDRVVHNDMYSLSPKI